MLLAGKEGWKPSLCIIFSSRIYRVLCVQVVQCMGAADSCFMCCVHVVERMGAADPCIVCCVQVVERMGAADPYFTPSTATVNPFTRVKLPAPSRLTVQDGARFCHSLPDPLPAHRIPPADRQQRTYRYYTGTLLCATFMYELHIFYIHTK